MIPEAVAQEVTIQEAVVQEITVPEVTVQEAIVPEITLLHTIVVTGQRRERHAKERFRVQRAIAGNINNLIVYRHPAYSRALINRSVNRPSFFKTIYMSDDLSKRRPQDANKVNIHEPWEVDYWCKEFGCTKEQLIAAVKAVGTSVSKVREYLKK